MKKLLFLLLFASMTCFGQLTKQDVKTTIDQKIKPGLRPVDIKDAMYKQLDYTRQADSVAALANAGLAFKAPLSHIHAAGDITSGTLGYARGGTGLGSIGTSGQLLRTNLAGTGLEYFSPTYLTSYTETDPLVGSHIKAISTTNISNWNTAYSWGDHAGLYASLSGSYSDPAWLTISKSKVGLGNVDNTSDLNKPISTATQTALNAKEPTISTGTTGQYWRGDKTWVTLDKSAVGLGNVDNTSDLNKAISTATQAALDLKANSSALSNYALLGGANTFTSSQSFTAPYNDYQVTFGQSGESARTRYLTTGASSTIGYSSQNGVDFAVTSNTGSGLLGLTHNGGTGYVRLAATGASGTIRFQTSATEAGRIFSNGNWRLGSTGVDNGSKLQVEGAATIEGQLTTQNVVPDGNNTRDLGAGGARWNNIYGANFIINSSAAVTFGSINSASPIQIRQGNSSQLIAGFFATSGRMFLQPASTIPTDNNVDQLQVTGSANFTGPVRAVGSVFTGTWSGYQMNIGGLGEGARIQLLRGIDGVQGFRMGFTSATANQVEQFTGSSMTITAGLGLTLTSTSTSAPTIVSATGTSGTVRLQTQATERLRINSDGTIIADKSGTMTSAGYDLDVVGTARVTGVLTLNDGTIEKTTAGNFTINGGAVAVNATFRANSGVLAGGTNSLDPSAILEARSTSKAFLPPRMTEAQKNAISSPATGSIIVQLDGSEGLWIKTSTSWKQLAFVP